MLISIARGMSILLRGCRSLVTALLIAKGDSSVVDFALAGWATCGGFFVHSASGSSTWIWKVACLSACFSKQLLLGSSFLEDKGWEVKGEKHVSICNLKSFWGEKSMKEIKLQLVNICNTLSGQFKQIYISSYEWLTYKGSIAAFNCSFKMADG